MIVQNVLEPLVWQQLDGVLDRNPGVCRCEKCKADIVAYTLNHMKPHYVVSDKGSILAKAKYMDTGHQIEMLVTISAAIKQVSEHPRHEQEQKNE